MCSARALARRGRRALPGAVHGGVAVAAVEAALEAAGRVARPRSSSARQQEGEEVGATRGGQHDGKKRPRSLSTAPASVPSVGGGAEQSREVEVEEKDGFAISKNSRDYSVNQ